MAFRLRPGQRGVALRLHDLEAEIMDIVWSRRLRRFAVSDVLAVLEKRREVAYTTVMTTVARLHDKGLLSRERDGKRYLYAPCGDREEEDREDRTSNGGLSSTRPPLAPRSGIALSSPALVGYRAAIAPPRRTVRSPLFSRAKLS